MNGIRMIAAVNIAVEHEVIVTDLAFWLFRFIRFDVHQHIRSIETE